MKQRRLVVAMVAAALVSLGTGCDAEDRRDVEEVERNVKEGAEDVGKEVEKGIDNIDGDGKDD